MFKHLELRSSIVFFQFRDLKQGTQNSWVLVQITRSSIFVLQTQQVNRDSIHTKEPSSVMIPSDSSFIEVGADFTAKTAYIPSVAANLISFAPL